MRLNNLRPTGGKKSTIVMAVHSSRPEPRPPLEAVAFVGGKILSSSLLKNHTHNHISEHSLD
jgi:hypothetical protein